MTGSSCPWVASALFLDAEAHRLEALSRAAADRAIDWNGIADSLELHGVLPLVARNLLAAGVNIPPDVRSDLALRERELREDARRARFTLVRFLSRADARGIRVVLLKGASLTLDLYEDPAFRHQADVDVLVEPAQVRQALSAARDAGFGMSPRQLPAWWYRLAHFHIALKPAVSLMKPLEIHWRLHSPALLLTTDGRRLRERATAVRVETIPAFALDPVDRLLHLATHLASHGRGIRAHDAAEQLAAWFEDPAPPVLLKWVLDLACAAESLAARTAHRELIRTAAEWNAEAALGQALNLIAACPLSEDARAWVRRLLAALPTSEPRRLRAAGSPHAAMNFRLDVLDLLPRWIWPPRTYLQRRYRISRRLPLLALRPLHAGLVLLHAGVAALALPVALLCRFVLGPARRRRRALEGRGDRLSELARAWRETG